MRIFNQPCLRHQEKMNRQRELLRKHGITYYSYLLLRTNRNSQCFHFINHIPTTHILHLHVHCTHKSFVTNILQKQVCNYQPPTITVRYGGIVPVSYAGVQRAGVCVLRTTVAEEIRTNRRRVRNPLARAHCTYTIYERTEKRPRFPYRVRPKCSVIIVGSNKSPFLRPGLFRCIITYYRNVHSQTNLQLSLLLLSSNIRVGSSSWFSLPARTTHGTSLPRIFAQFAIAEFFRVKVFLGIIFLKHCV